MSIGLVMPVRLVERGLCGKSWHIHFTPPFGWLGLTVKVRRQPGHQEWKLLSHINAHTKLLGEIGLAVGIGKDDLDDVTRATQWRGTHLHSRQRKVAREFFSRLGINGRVTHS